MYFYTHVTEQILIKVREILTYFNTQSTNKLYVKIQKELYTGCALRKNMLGNFLFTGETFFSLTKDYVWACLCHNTGPPYPRAK